MIGVNGHYLFPKGHPMTKKQKSSRSLSNGSKHVVKTARSGSATHALSRDSAGKSVTPTSERIIKATSVKRRTAMKVLANR